MRVNNPSPNSPRPDDSNKGEGKAMPKNRSSFTPISSSSPSARSASPSRSSSSNTRPFTPISATAPSNSVSTDSSLDRIINPRPQPSNGPQQSKSRPKPKTRKQPSKARTRDLEEDSWDFGDPTSGNGKSRGRRKPRRKLSKKTVIISVASFVALSLVAWYFLWFTAPVAKIDESKTGASAMASYLTCLNDYDVDCLKESAPDSYLVAEQAYFNGNETRLGFLKKMVSTVSMSLPQSRALDWWGNPAQTSFKHTPVMRQSTLNFGEEADFTYPDYANIPLDITAIKKLADEAKLTSTDFDYASKATDIFAKYVTSLDVPTKTVTRQPFLDCSGEGTSVSCKVDPKEDAFWDQLLFSSDDFIQIQKSFSEVLWKSLGSETTADAPQLDAAWIGAYLLSGGSKEGTPDGTDKIEPRVGDGTFDSPAGLNTPIKTVQIDSKGNSHAIEVSLVEFKTGEPAFKIMEKRSQQNRGFSTDSTIKYAYYRFQVRNISKDKLTLTANDSLSDPQRTLTPRVGTVYGLTSYVDNVAPGATVNIESWTSASNLSSLYLLWGANFPRTVEPIWFRVLASVKSPASDSSSPAPASTYSPDPQGEPSPDSTSSPDSPASEEGSGALPDTPTPDAEPS